jgi:hypothetical protein
VTRPSAGTETVVFDPLLPFRGRGTPPVLPLSDATQRELPKDERNEKAKETIMLKNLMSKLAAARDGAQQQQQQSQSRPERTHVGCTMEAMEDRLLMASDYLYTGVIDGSDVRPMESLSLNFTKGSTVGFVIYGK